MDKRLTDEEILDIARRVAEAVARAPEGDPRLDILAKQHELPPEDEGRVIAALAKLRAG